MVSKSDKPTDKPKRQLSEAELQQRRDAAKKSTGPKTEEGKAISSRNAYKHGMHSAAADEIRRNWSVGAFAKPCKSTCQYHPESGGDCSLVVEKLTKAGGDCLDKTIYVQAFDRLLSSMQSGNADAMHEVLAAEAAGALEVLQHLRNEIAEHGLVREIVAIDSEGGVICHEGKPVAGKLIANPALHYYQKMLGELGINLAELMATPRAVSKATDADDAADAVNELFGRIANAFPAKRQPRTIDVTPDAD